MTFNEPPVILPAHPISSAGPSKCSDHEPREEATPGRWPTTGLTITAACVTPILYILFLDRFATNAFQIDDWSVVPIVHATLHSHLPLTQLWDQHNESRLVIGNIVDVVFGFTNRLDLRSIMFFSGLIFILSYAGLLALIRNYIGRRLTPIPVLVTGVIWFSLADIQNALWAFQVSWYLTVFFFITMLVVLLVPNDRRTLWFGVAVVAAAAASLSTIQGFLCWPIGAVCILWNEPRARHAVRQFAAWIGGLIVTLALYLPGYKLGEANSCLVRSSCSTSAILHHPLTSLGFFFGLIGNVIPGPPGTGNPVHSVTRFEVVGVALFAVGAFLLVQSWRRRKSTEHLPLPSLLILFSLLFDVTISVGRSGTGPTGAINANRFVMPNLILLVGVVIYAWSRMSIRPPSVTHGQWRVRLIYLAPIALAIFLVVQASTATNFGLTNGRVSRNTLTQEAQSFVTLRGTHLNQQRQCQLFAAFAFFFPPASTVRDAATDHLGEFDPSSVRHYERLGPPPVPPVCRQRHT